MRKLVSSNMMSLDGFFEGQGASLAWHNTDDDFHDAAVDQLETLDLILFGRVTYQMMASFWPTPMAMKVQPRTAELMNQTPKIVFSHTLETADWHNTRLIKGDVVATVREMKQQAGKNIAVFGSANLLRTLMAADLIDEYRVIINPVILGSGSPLFQNLESPLALQLIKQTTFGSGNVFLYYRPATRNE